MAAASEPCDGIMPAAGREGATAVLPELPASCATPCNVLHIPDVEETAGKMATPQEGRLPSASSDQGSTEQVSSPKEYHPCAWLHWQQVACILVKALLCDCYGFQVNVADVYDDLQSRFCRQVLKSS